MATYPLRFGIQTPQQNTTWAELLLALWQELDALGYDTAWLFDHLLQIFSAPSGPCLEGWTALAALAMATRRIRFGLMVAGNTYRHPAMLAKMATTTPPPASPTSSSQSPRPIVQRSTASPSRSSRATARGSRSR